MQPLRFAPTLVLSTVILFACDPEQPDDVIADELELGEPMLGDLPSELVELELEAPSNQQTTEGSASCGVYGPQPSSSRILADTNIETIELNISTPTTALFDFDVVQSIPPYISSFSIQQKAHPYAIVSTPTSSPGTRLFIGSDGDLYDLTLEVPANATPGAYYIVKVKLHDENGDLCNYHYVYMEIPDCTSVGWWSTTPWPAPWFDGANCYVATLPPGQTSFVWNNSWYVVPTAGNQCAIGVFDGANCYIGSAPGGYGAFIWDNNLYFEAWL